MSNNVLIKRSAVPAKEPLAGDLDFGELAINYADGILFYKDSTGNVSQLVNVNAGGLDAEQVEDVVGAMVTGNTRRS